MDNESKLARELLAANPFAPLASAHAERRKQHSLDYIAFYLREIEKHISTIANAIGEQTANSTEIRVSLESLQTILPELLAKR
jgi:methyl-accepting chemotaxis protein